jgi:tetratricopeptide (TPR) repeat protein
MRKNQVLGAVPLLLSGLLLASPAAWAQRGSIGGGSRPSPSVGSGGSRGSIQGGGGSGGISRPSPAPSSGSSAPVSRPSSPPPSYGGRSSGSSSGTSRAPVVRYAPPSVPSTSRESFDRGRSASNAPVEAPAARGEIAAPRSALPEGLSNRGASGEGFMPSVEPAPRRVPFPSLAPSTPQRGRSSGLRSSAGSGPSAVRLRDFRAGPAGIGGYEPGVRTRALDRSAILERYSRSGAAPESSAGPSASRLGRSAPGREAALGLGRTRGAGEALSEPARGRAPVLAAPGPARTRAANLLARGRSAPAPINAEASLKSLRQLARENPARARAMLSAGNAISGATGASLWVGAAVTGGIFWGPGWCDPLFNGWFFWWGFPHGWFWWGAPAHCWSPWGWWWWGCSPWWWNSYYPVYYSPPVYYATVVHHYYDDGYSSGGMSYAEPPPDQGEGVAQAPVERGPVQVGRASEEALVRAASQYLTLGDQAFRDGRYADSVHFYAKAIEYQPQDGVLYLVLSDALFATGDYHYGAYALRKALELDPSQARKVVDKHGFYGDPTEFDRQLAVLETYLVDHPGDTDARLLLAANYLFGGRPAAAVDLLESPAGEAVRSSAAGALILSSAKELEYGPRPSGARSF